MNEAIMETAVNTAEVTAEAMEAIAANAGMIDEQTVKYILAGLGVAAGLVVIWKLNKKFKLTTKAKEFLSGLFKKKEEPKEEGGNGEDK